MSQKFLKAPAVNTFTALLLLSTLLSMTSCSSDDSTTKPLFVNSQQPPKTIGTNGPSPSSMNSNRQQVATNEESTEEASPSMMMTGASAVSPAENSQQANQDEERSFSAQQHTGPLLSEEELNSYLEWTAIGPRENNFLFLSGNATDSSAHGGSCVKVFANEIARLNFSESLSPATKAFGTGAVLAMAAFRPSGRRGESVLFMKKMPSGFDEENGNWAYAVGVDNGFQTVLEEQGKIAFCLQCHTQFRQHDSVLSWRHWQESQWGMNPWSSCR